MEKVRTLIAVSLGPLLLLLLFSPTCAGQVSPAEMAQIAAMFHRGEPQSQIMQSWQRYFESHPKTNVDAAVSALRQAVEKQGAEKSLTAWDRVQTVRKMQAAVKAELDTAKSAEKGGRTTPQLRKKNFQYKGNQVVVTPGDAVTNQAEYVKALEAKLSSVGDDAQLANVDLQNVLQKQQQTLQQMSNISKMLHDTAMAVVRKIGG